VRVQQDSDIPAPHQYLWEKHTMNNSRSRGLGVPRARQAPPYETLDRQSSPLPVR
jgi:hypothetical protein